MTKLLVHGNPEFGTFTFGESDDTMGSLPCQVVSPFHRSSTRRQNALPTARVRAIKTIKAHFDGRVFVPEARVDLPVGSDVEVVVASSSTNAAPTSETLQGLLRIAAELPDNPDSPSDLAAQHDHYLYGTPKRP